MFIYEIRYQTGELRDLVEDLKNNLIPKLDCDNIDKLNWCLEQLKTMGVTEDTSIPRDKYAIDRDKFYDYEYRIAFNVDGIEGTRYVDIYFEPTLDDDYDPISEM